MNKKRNVYLKMKTLAEAREIILNEFDTTGHWAMETIDGTGCRGQGPGGAGPCPFVSTPLSCGRNGRHRS